MSAGSIGMRFTSPWQCISHTFEVLQWALRFSSCFEWMF